MSSGNEEAIKEVVPGIYQIRLPIPIRSLRYVFAYLVCDQGHNLLIDTGWPSKEAYSSLESSLSKLGFSLSEIETILVSHLHPDHFGLAEQIRDAAPGSKLIMHEADAASIFDDYSKYRGFMEDMNMWLEENGTPERELKAMLDASLGMLQFFRPPKPTSVIRAGDVIEIGERWKFEVIHTPGHTKGTICLYDHGGSRVLFSGDHVLPTITPNISLGAYYEGDPLGDYLEALDRVGSLDVSIVLPSHEYVFSDLKKRVEEIKLHHDQRLQNVISVMKASQKNVDDAVSGYEVSSKLHWYSGRWDQLGGWEKRAALTETLAHLEYLKRRGNIVEVQRVVDGKQRMYYSLIES